ncbi:MAG TPA: hypothetical protein VFP65_28050 [Anaeromyxobacteraceae bacterium]|nr:hypothetical protein [Anaeromyxobacteraceae bacterium]
MAEAEAERRWGKPASGKSTFLTLAVVLLLGLVGWLLAERNARLYFLVFEDGTLSVKRGVLFPVGKAAFKTDDPALAAAYAPLKPPPGAKVEEERGFEDRSSLDQGLYDLLARWARDDLASGKPEGTERALGWLARADKLAGISAVQRDDLRSLRAESGWFEARQLLERAADALRQARERLRLTAGSSSPHAGDANEALRRMEPVVDEIYRAGKVLAPAPGEQADAPTAHPQPAAAVQGGPAK